MRQVLAAAALLAAAGGAGAQAFSLPQDTNHDGYQTFEELSVWYTDHVRASDVNHDKAVSKAEFAHLYEQQLRSGLFAKADVNKDGKLTGLEIAAAANMIANGDMAFCDANKDGKISNAEDDLCVSGETIKR